MQKADGDAHVITQLIDKDVKYDVKAWIASLSVHSLEVIEKGCEKYKKNATSDTALRVYAAHLPEMKQLEDRARF